MAVIARPGGGMVQGRVMALSIGARFGATLWVRRCLAALGLLVATFSHLPPAVGQTADERAAARALALEGSTAFKEQRWEDAIRYFMKAEDLVHAPPHLLFSAKAHIELKRLVEANDLLLKVKNETLPPNAPPAFQRAQEEAFELLQQLKPRMSYLAVDVKNAGTAPLEIRVDSVKLDAVFRGVPKAVNPGEHKVSALSDGLRADEQSVQVAEGERKRVELELRPDPSARLTPLAAPPQPAAAEPAAAEPAAPAPASATAPGPDTGPSQEEKPGWLKIAPYAAFGVGAVGLGLGTVFALDSASKRSEADDEADALEERCGDRCPANDPAARKIDGLDADAGSAQTLAIVGFVVGGVGVAAGTTLLVLDLGGSGGDSAAEREGSRSRAALRIAPLLSLRGGPGVRGATLSGTF
jgi:hypothetical protein